MKATLYQEETEHQAEVKDKEQAEETDKEEKES
jgi:hypothetical protein